MRFIVFLGLVINFFLLVSCKKYTSSEGAFFIKPASVSVSTTSVQGTGNHKITDLWLYVNGKFQGAYPTGNLMPVISKNEKVKINIIAGIKNNGISGTRLGWAFYDFITIDTLVENGKTIDRPLTFKYNDNAKFVWMENFDQQGFSLVKSSSNPTDTTWKFANPNDHLEGKCAEIGLTGNALVAQVESSTTFALPSGNNNVYLELNYKCNQGFEVGVLAGVIQKSTVFITPSENWNKIYIQLSDAINRSPNSSNHKIYFKMVKTDDNPNPKMFIDNIKLLTF
jgi:hypothetical protein